MAKTLTDVETKTKEAFDGTYETTKKRRGWKFWIFAPVGLATVAAGAFFIVRRRFGSSAK